MMMVCLNAVDGDAQLNEALKLLPDIVKLLNHQDSTNLSKLCLLLNES